MWMGEAGGLVGTRYMSGEVSMLTKTLDGYEFGVRGFLTRFPKGTRG